MEVYEMQHSGVSRDPRDKSRFLSYQDLDHQHSAPHLVYLEKSLS